GCGKRSKFRGRLSKRKPRLRAAKPGLIATAGVQSVANQNAAHLGAVGRVDQTLHVVAIRAADIGRGINAEAVTVAPAPAVMMMPAPGRRGRGGECGGREGRGGAESDDELAEHGGLSSFCT